MNGKTTVFCLKFEKFNSIPTPLRRFGWKKNELKGLSMIVLSAFADEAASGIKEQIAALKRNSIPYVELRSVGGKNVMDFTVAEAEEYRKTFSGEGIGVWAIGSPLGKSEIGEPFGIYFERAKHIFELANIFGCKRVRAFSFFHAYKAKEKVFERLEKTAELAEKFGVCLCHENEKEIYGDSLQRVQELMKSVKELRFIYDPANFIQAGEDAARTLDALFEKTDYFHIKDIIKDTGELVPAGYGDGKIEDIIRRIDSDKTLTLEPHLALFEGYGAIDRTEMKNKFHFSNNDDAFDAAAKALKELLEQAGYREQNGGYVKS